MKKHLFLPIVAILLTLTSCNNKSEAPTVGQRVLFDRVCDKISSGTRIAGLLTLTGCNNKPGAPTVGKQVLFDRVCDKINSGNRIAVEGFLTLSEQIYSKDQMSLLLKIRPAKEMSPQQLGVWTSYGDKVNQLSLVKSSLGLVKPAQNGKLADDSTGVNTNTHQDFHVKTNDGKIVGDLDRVRVSGKVGFPHQSSLPLCVLENPLFESIK